MDCGSFERELAGLAAGPAAAERGCVSRLRQHARQCPECAGSAGLLEVLGRPAAQRELGDDPGAAYWEAFAGRVRARIDRDELAPAAKVRGRSRVPFLAAAAAALALLGAWALWRDSTDTATRRGSGSDEQPAWATADLPPPGLADGDVSAQADVLAGWAASLGAATDGEGSEAWGGAGPLPDVADLDDDTRLALLRWLNAQSL